jgi:hypothetical protein
MPGTHLSLHRSPSLLYLAIDIAAAIADIGAAKAAFTTLKEAMAVAKVTKAGEGIPKLVQQMRSANISAVNQGKVIAEILPVGGDVRKALNEIRLVFMRTAEQAADKDTAKLMQLVAENAMNRGKVLVVPNNKVAAYDVLRTRLTGRGLDADATTTRFLKELFAQDSRAAGFYDPTTKLIMLRGNATAEAAASVLVHETVHLGQDTQKLLGRMSTYNSEFEAFKAQQQFLGLLPGDRVPEQWVWLLKANDSTIEAHILEAYKAQGATKPAGIDHAALADEVFGRLFAAGGAK